MQKRKDLLIAGGIRLYTRFCPSSSRPFRDDFILARAEAAYFRLRRQSAPRETLLASPGLELLICSPDWTTAMSAAPRPFHLVELRITYRLAAVGKY